MAELKEHQSLREVNLGQEIAPFENLTDESLPINIGSNPYSIPNVGTITFEITQDIGKVDTKRLNFKNPKRLIARIEPDEQFNTSQDRLNLALNLGIRTKIADRQLWGVPSFFVEKGTIIFPYWSTKPLKGRDKLPQKPSVMNPLIIDTYNTQFVKSLKFEVSDLTLGKLKKTA